jgi:hypothetical protein
MSATRNKFRLVPNLLLATILVAAQWGTLVHALDHDIGSPQSTVCTTCVAASQLGFACVDTAVTTDAAPAYQAQHSDFVTRFETIHALVARQRGPPSLL